nr:hypothetical protein Itr_chr02CG11150 [Ipomoea trifida]
MTEILVVAFSIANVAKELHSIANSVTKIWAPRFRGFFLTLRQKSLWNLIMLPFPLYYHNGMSSVTKTVIKWQRITFRRDDSVAIRDFS